MYPPFGTGLNYFGASWGTLTLTETTQAFVEPLSFEEAAAYLKLPSTDMTDPGVQAELTLFIQAAREQAEILQNRDLVRKQWDMSRDYWPYGEVELRPHLVSVDLIQTKDIDGNVSTLTENTDYVVDTSKHPGLILPPANQPWSVFVPWPSSSILIRFTSGVAPNSVFWQDAGTRVKIGMKYLIAEWYTNRMPLERGRAAANEYPDPITACLSYGAVPSVR